jgi:hypothetical protein
MPEHARYRRDDSKHFWRVPFRLHPRSDQDRHLHGTETFQEICGENGIPITPSERSHNVGRADVATTAAPDVDPRDPACEIAERDRSQQIAPDHDNGQREHGPLSGINGRLHGFRVT